MMKYMFMMIFLIPLLNNYWLLMNIFMLMFFLFMYLIISYNFTVICSLLMGLDLMSYLMISLSFFIIFLMMMSSYKIYYFNDKLLYFVFFIIMMMISLFMLFCSLNLLLFYIFFEVSLIPIIMLIFGWGYQPERISASYYLLFYTMFASLPLLLGILYIYYTCYSLDFYLIYLKNNNFYFYISMVLAFLFKMPMPFFHFWLPKAHVEAPVAGSMILAGILLKLGGYGLIRVFMFMNSYYFNYSYFLMILSLWGSFYISLLCIFQIDIKSMIAYSSVAHMSLVICGIMSFTLYGNVGSLIMMIGHGFCSSALFCLANIVYERSFSRSLFVNKGYLVSMPSLSLFWFIFCSNNMSSPPSLNLFGEICLINTIMSWNYYTFMFLFILSFMSCCYSIYLFSITQHGNLYSLMTYYKLINIREYMLMIFHLIPLNFMFISLSMFSSFV
uniref:NADH dehydrogenase subunit 4 n=1 Tax=Chalcopis glandulosa TaxID=3021795 RepID=UPI0023AAE6B8|nr:NADH dehydrogenase subunit 4 [Chalcopis glandulosa]WCB99323.1 NADH dehydrogenase subunit 4 [Chalcopis glandulosa]